MDRTPTRGAMIRLRLQVCLIAAVCALIPVSGEGHHQDRVNANEGQEIPQDIPVDLNTAREVISENKLYKVRYSVPDNTIPYDKLHEWLLSVSDQNGTLIDDVQVEVTSSMPKHPHGTIAQPLVTRHLGKGLHLVEGVLFHMKGWWVTTFTLRRGDSVDRAQFNVIVQ